MAGDSASEPTPNDARRDQQQLIPTGYSFINFETMMSDKAQEMLLPLLDQVSKRRPDDFGMYIYNDFFSYGVFDLVHKTLAKLNTKIMKKDWKEAFPILECLHVFVDIEGIWTQCDDGHLVNATKTVIGAAALAVFQGIEKAGSAASFPSLENLMHNFCQACESDLVCNRNYLPIFTGMARRMFSGKTDTDVVLERKMLEEWVRGLDEDSENDMDDEDDEDEDEDAAPKGKKGMLERLNKMAQEHETAQAAGKPIAFWFSKGAATEKVHNTLKYARAWKEYKAQASGPSLPMMGPPKWDLTTWTAAEKSPFLF